uniref:Regulator of G-protein signaling loco n=2 Tax=Cacopsylla melanoneura TaxID=428564 RepID=A0A8D8Q0L3_9HEMI
MQPVRRRKKRPNYGVRTVEVNRGKNGFGFTISGQQPCILSCINSGSPAEFAGLRAGDYLIAVCGQNVSKMPHDDVVRLIATCPRTLKLQIAENYYSDSSDEDLILSARHKPKYPHKPKNSNIPRCDVQNRAAKVVRDLRTGALFEEQIVVKTSPKKASPGMNQQQWKSPSHVPLPLPRLYLPGPSHENAVVRDEDEEVLSAIVGYLGTIEMPRKLPPASRPQVVRGCIKKLRTEKRTPTMVLMTLFTRSLRLQNNNRATLVIYPADRVTYCGSSSEEDRKHFGVVTTSADADPSNSCHVFAMDFKPHAEHLSCAMSFKVECTLDPMSGSCHLFPVTSDNIVQSIKKFYESSNDPVEVLAIANSPLPSNDSTTTTSNSDSGIGFRDDYSGQPDRILVVDIQNQRLHIQQSNGRTERLTVRAMPDPANTSNRSRSPLSTSSEGPFNLALSHENMSISSGHRRSPDVFRKVQSLPNTPVKSIDNMSLGSTKSQDILMSYKLSPKVFGVTKPPPVVTQSLEDLKSHQPIVEDTSLNTTVINRTLLHPWGSLQELRSFVSDCYEDSRTSEIMHESPERSSVSSWASSFEKLLYDPTGLHMFAEFLKKEFSHENIYFWVACEKFQAILDCDQRRRLAQEIFNKHLASGASEPVNVDSQAMQKTQEQLELGAETNLFQETQKQIFNLMKFDSYPRFLKSDLYKDCLLKEISGEEVTYTKDEALELTHLLQQKSPPQLKKSRSDVDERRRKSLLPWTRSKSRDRSLGDGHASDSLSARGDSFSGRGDSLSLSSSRSSLASWDVTMSQALCRVALPDQSTAVVQIKPDQSIREVVMAILEKRALAYNSFQVFLGNQSKALTLDEDASILRGQEIHIEPRIVFRLDLPNRKTIVIKSKEGKDLDQVLRPILPKYGYRLDMVTLCLMSENEVIEHSAPVESVDNQRLQVLTRSTPTPTSNWRESTNSTPKPKGASTLDEITNRVFEELLQGKAEGQNMKPLSSDQGSMRSDDWGSEHSSGILGRFLRRDSVMVEKQRDRNKKKATTSNTTGADRKPSISKLPPLIAKLKPGVKLEGRSESDVIYEGLKRAQRCRLEDQRGTEINFELPDFLKDKENAPNPGGQAPSKVRRFRRDTREDLNGDAAIMPPPSTPPPPLPPKPKNLAPAWPSPMARYSPAFGGGLVLGKPPYGAGDVPAPACRIYLDQPSSSFV